MADSSSRASSLTSRSPSPEPPVQPDHFWGQDEIQCPPSPNSDGRTWLEPEDDPFAQRGIPVFKPSMDEFADFEAYMKKVECWGMRSGIVKVIPPKEWTDSLPPVGNQLNSIKLNSPIEQNMIGRSGLFRQSNVEKKKAMSLREWVELCSQDDYRAPSVKQVGLPTERAPPPPLQYRGHGRRTKKNAPSESPAKSEPPEDTGTTMPSPPHSEQDDRDTSVKTEEEVKQGKTRNRTRITKEEKDAKAAESAILDEEFLRNFEPHKDWLPPGTLPEDYTPEFCRKLERQYWRNCGLGKPAWYGADTAGSLFTDKTTSWNVGHLPSMLARLLPASGGGLPGVNMPYLYFGMWRATFAWHVEDMDLFSINYIHFGAPKFWYAVPQARAGALEQTMKGYFPRDIKGCPQFLRHKSFLASPNLLSQSACKPNTCVQQPGEFMITYPMGYHAGFNLGLNCAESVNFALDSWLDLARKAKVCNCVEDSVRIDVDALLEQRELEEKDMSAKPANKGKENERSPTSSTKSGRKRKAPVLPDHDLPVLPPPKKKSKPKTDQNGAVPGKILSVKLTLGPRPVEPVYVCCLCVSTNEEGLLRVHDPPRAAEAGPAHPELGYWRAHASCASIVTETWVDEIELPDGTQKKLVFGVDSIPRDRWNLKCTLCTRPKAKTHGAPIQCTKGKCPKAFHVSCARESDPSSSTGVILTLEEVQREIIIADAPNPEVSLPVQPVASTSSPIDVDMIDSNGILPPPVLEAEPQRRLFKIINKSEYQLLCHQHNPATYEAKKSSKVERQRAQPLALAPMSRIKIRVSAGVFEVSLVRVMEETGSVEVVWDRGVKREFKFSSIVFGHTKDDVIGHKPMEIAPQIDYAALAQQHAQTMQQLASTPSLNASDNGWATSYPYGHYVDPRMFVQPTNSQSASPVPPSVIYPRPAALDSVSRTASSAGSYAGITTVPTPVPSPAMAPSGYRNIAPAPAPEIRPVQPNTNFRWKESYQDPRSSSGSPVPAHTPAAVAAPRTVQPPRSGMQHYPQVQYQPGMRGSGYHAESSQAASGPFQTHAPIPIDPALIAVTANFSSPAAPLPAT